MEADVFSREPNGLIALRITQDEWDELRTAIAFAIRLAERHNCMEDRYDFIRLANRLNVGNPDFVQCEVSAEARAGAGRPE